MKRIAFLLIALFAFAATLFAEDLSPIIGTLQKQRMLAECKRSPNIGKDWREHCMGAADIYAVTGLVYSASAKTPTPTVKLNGTTLTAGTDFTFGYVNNTNAGWATLTVAANKKGYFGTQYHKFSIAPFTLTNGVVAAISQQSYTGLPVEPLPTVTCLGKTLTKGTDYNVGYADNIQTGTTAKVIVTGIGNFRGEVVKTFTIAQ